MRYAFLGSQPRLYQFFQAEPGDVFDFDAESDVPTDGLWIPADPSDAPAPESPAQEPSEPSGPTASEIADLEAHGFTVTPPGE